MITLFSTNCPKCKILEQKLNQKKISFEISDNVQEIIDRGFMTAPVLKVNDIYMDFGQAVKWINSVTEDEIHEIYTNFGQSVTWINATVENSDCKSCEV